MSTTTNPPELLIVGAGVLALTTATLLQSLLPNATITIIASEFPSQSPIISTPTSTSIQPASPSYASMWAGAHYRPIPSIPSTHPSFPTLPQDTRKFHLQLAREARWALTTAERMKKLARTTPEAGVQIVDGEEYLEDPPLQNLLLRTGDVYASPDDGFRVWDGREVEALNERVGRCTGTDRNSNGNSHGNVKWAATYETYVVNPHIYTACLLSRFTQNGGHTIQRRLHRLTDALDYAQSKPGSVSPRSPVIINCTGTGLTNDPSTTPIRGQTVLLRKPYHKTVTRQCTDGTWSFLIPRPLDGGTVIGGTKQIGDTHGAARPEERKKLLENARRYFPEFLRDAENGEETESEIVCDNVGFRPGRTGGVRVEREDVKVGNEVVSIVHGYGAGGRGYEISWGVAGDLCELVGACLSGSQGGERKAKL